MMRPQTSLFSAAFLCLPSPSPRQRQGDARNAGVGQLADTRIREGPRVAFPHCFVGQNGAIQAIFTCGAEIPTSANKACELGFRRILVAHRHVLVPSLAGPASSLCRAHSDGQDVVGAHRFTIRVVMSDQQPARQILLYTDTPYDASGTSQSRAKLLHG